MEDNHHQQKRMQEEEQPYLLHEHLLHHQYWPPLQGQQQQPLLQHHHQPYLLHHQQQQQLVQQGVIIHENSQSLLDSMPRGYRFCPTDQELIMHYLRKRIARAPLPLNRIHEVNIYDHNPQELANRYILDSFYNVNGWYFFTSLTKKYPNGERPSRSCKDGGFWKPTGKDKKIHYEGKTIGYKKSLDFLFRSQPSDKTPWKMHEYRIHSKNPKSDPVLCKLYLKIKRKKGCEDEGDALELVRENLDHGLIVNQAPMLNENSDFVIGNSSSTGSTNNPCMEYFTTLDSGGDASSNQVVYDMSFFQFPHPFQDFQEHTNSHSGVEGITQSTQGFTETFHLSKSITMIPSNLNMEDVSKYSIGGADLSNSAWQNCCAGGYVNMTTLKDEVQNLRNK